MFRRPISRRGWLVLIAAAGGALLAAGRGQTPTQNYYPGYSGSAYDQTVYGSTAAQVRARGAQERAFAAGIADHAMGRMNATIRQAQQFDQHVLVGQ
jgi:hypothetical protein